MSYKLFNRFLFLISIILLLPNLTIFSNNTTVHNYYSLNLIQSIESERFEGYNLIVFGCIIGAFIAVVIRRRKRGAVPNPHEQIAIKKSDGSG